MAELPRGWTIASLQDVALINPKHPPETTPDTMISFVPMQAVSESGWKFLRTEERRYSDVRKGYTHFAEDDVLLAKITPCFENGKAAIARELRNGLGCGTTELHVLRPLGGIRPEYLYHYLHQESFRHSAVHNMTGTAGQLRVPLSHIEQVRLPLPPLPEQRRIVAKLEELLSKVDACQKRLDRIPLILKRFRQSVLAAACSGKLTEEWRRTHRELSSAKSLLATEAGERGKKRKRAGRLWGAGVVPVLTEEEREDIPPRWVWAKVRQLGKNPEDTVQVGPMSMASRDFSEAGVPVLNVGCVQWGRFDESKLDHMPHEKARQFDRYRIQKDDILFTRSGTIGRCAIASKKQDGYLMTFHLLRVRPSANKCLPQYLQFVFQGARHIRRQTEGAAIGSTRAGFNTNLLAGIDVPLPPLIEQEEIVRSAGALFELADQIESRHNAAKESVDQLTQSILARAFRGELMPQDPNDESATKLLERIRASKPSRQQMAATTLR